MLLLKAGANVVLTTKGIDDLCLKYFVETNAIAVRRCRKEDLARIASATGATLVTTFGDLEGNESFDSSLLGTADVVEQIRVADDEVSAKYNVVCCPPIFLFVVLFCVLTHLRTKFQRLSRQLIVVRGAAKATASSVILRGPNTYALDEMERALHDALVSVTMRRPVSLVVS